MLPLETLVLFFSTSVALAIAPGPDNIFVLTQSAVSGRKAGFYITLGLCSGLVVHTLAVILGVAVIFQTSALAFTALKLFGAGYLLYLAYGAFTADSQFESNADYQSPKPRQLYVRGVIMNISNPKVALFFLAFLPQFTQPESGSLTLQLCLLGALFSLAALLVFNLIAFFSGELGERLAHSGKAQSILNKLAGTVFTGLAIKLILSER